MPCIAKRGITFYTEIQALLFHKKIAKVPYKLDQQFFYNPYCRRRRTPGEPLSGPRLLPCAGIQSETAGKTTQTSPIVHIHSEP